MLDSFVRDLLYALRVLRRRPGFALAAVFTLALGISLTTAVLAVVDATLARGLPFEQPEGLVHLWQRRASDDARPLKFSWPAFKELQAESNTFRGVAVYTLFHGTWDAGGDPSPVEGLAVSANFLNVLGVTPLVGRGFAPGEDVFGAQGVALLDYRLWRDRFGADPAVLGRAIRVNGSLITVVGVLPPEFVWPPGGRIQLVTTVQPNKVQAELPKLLYFAAVGRLAEGLSLPQVRARLGPIAERLQGRHPDAPQDTVLFAVPLQEEFSSHLRPVLYLLLAAVSLVYLVSTANVAGLLLAHGMARSNEFAVRVALGGTRRRLVQQLLTESLLLAGIGVALGVALARPLLGWLLAEVPPIYKASIRLSVSSGIEFRTLVYCSVSAVVTALACGLWPAIQVWRGALDPKLKEAQAVGGRHRVHQLFIAAEIGTALVLLNSAALMGKSLMRVVAVDPGFQAAGVASLEVRCSSQQFKDEAHIFSFMQEVQRVTGQAPGVLSAAIVDKLPGTGAGGAIRFSRTDHSEQGTTEPEALYRRVSSEYFATMKVPLLTGRLFDERDHRDVDPVVIINRALQRQVFPGEDPIGKSLHFRYRPDAPSPTIIGVVGDEALGNLDEKREPAVYVPAVQAPYGGGFWVVLRAERWAVGPALRSQLAAAAPQASVLHARWLVEEMQQTPAMFLRRYPAFLLSIFAGVGLALACVGIFSLVTFTVLDDQRSFGLRLAMGATPAKVVGLVLARTVRTVAAGALPGLILAVCVSHLLRSMLFEVLPWDVSLLAIVLCIIGLTSVLAALPPALWATRVDPMVTLRAP